MSEDMVNCILSTAAVGDTTDKCLDTFLMNLGGGKKKEDYFLYESIESPATSETSATNRESMYVDSCEVYTGPATTLPVPNDFEDCIQDNAKQCNIPSFVWSGRSSGKTPVASFHSWKDQINTDGTTDQSTRASRAAEQLQDVSTKILQAIQGVNSTFQKDGIEVQLFSAEGDALHQLMDCMFMGPYSRMDYGSRGARNNLPIPSWSRADTETEEETRAFTECTSDKVRGDFATPFTCGSETRRSIIKYFVRDFAQDKTISGLCSKPDPNITVQEKNREVLVKIVQSRLTDLQNAWSDSAKLSCQGKDVDGNFINSFGISQCNQDDSSTWTPVQIRDWDHATSAQVAKELFASASCFHERSMYDADVWFRNMHKDERERYHWSKDDANSFSARESSLFHKHKPVISYGYDELDEPMHNGTVSMWEMCAGLLGHVHFTIPLAKNGRGQYVPTTLQSPTASYSPYTPSTTPTLTALENFILQVSTDAFEVSPFYRHYGMFHLPSDSAACPDFAAQAETAGSQKVPRGSQYTVRQEPELGHGNSSLLNLTSSGNLDQLPPIHRKGVMYGLLGAASRYRCFCDFERVAENETNTRTACDTGTCQLPGVIMQHILTHELPLTDDMEYLKTTIGSLQGGQFCMDQNEVVQRTLKYLWIAGTWPCPELDLSDQWGIVRDSSAWIQSEEGDEINANDLLEVGSGGLRPGTISQVLEESKKKITPAHRVGTMNPHDGSPLTGQTKCEMHRNTMRPETLAGHFVNDLFPAAQGLVDSPAVSHCMRFAIEVARLNVIAIVTGTNSTRESIISRLSSTANAWKQRCAAQIDLLSMCVMTKALDSRNGVYSSGNPTHCAFTLYSTEKQDTGVYRTPEAYITPGCLVYVFGTVSGTTKVPPTLHDPCMFYDCSSELSPLDVEEDIVNVIQTKVLFNPMEMVDPLEVRGNWPVKRPENSSYTDDEYASHLAKVKEWHDDLARDLPGRITDTSLFRRSVIDEEPSGVGSPNLWSNSGDESSRPLKTATEDNSKYCDMMVDWWPEHFDYPVAYHPTTPCHKDDSAFRTFDRSFTYNKTDHTMLYEPLAMRDMDYVHTHFGAEGLCRTSNVGLDMQVCFVPITHSVYPATYRFEPHSPFFPRAGSQHGTSMHETTCRSAGGSVCPDEDRGTRCSRRKYNLPGGTVCAELSRHPLDVQWRRESEQVWGVWMEVDPLCGRHSLLQTRVYILVPL